MKLAQDLRDLCAYLDSDEVLVNMTEILGQADRVQVEENSIEWLNYCFESEGGVIRAYSFGREASMGIQVIDDDDMMSFYFRGDEWVFEEVLIRHLLKAHLEDRFPDLSHFQYNDESAFRSQIANVAQKLKVRAEQEQWPAGRNEVCRALPNLFNQEIVNFICDPENFAEVRGYRQALPLLPTDRNRFGIVFYNVVARNWEAIRESLETQPKVLAYWLESEVRKELGKLRHPFKMSEEVTSVRSSRQMASSLRRTLGLTRVAWDRFLNPIEVDASKFPYFLRNEMKDVLSQSGATPSITVTNAVCGLTKSNLWSDNDLGALKPMFRALFTESDSDLATMYMTQKELADLCLDLYAYIRAAKARKGDEPPARTSLAAYIEDAKQFFKDSIASHHENACGLHIQDDEIPCWTNPVPAYEDKIYTVAPVANLCRAYAEGYSNPLAGTRPLNTFTVMSPWGRPIASVTDISTYIKMGRRWSYKFKVAFPRTIHNRVLPRLESVHQKAKELQRVGELPEDRLYYSRNPAAHCVHCGELLADGCDCRQRYDGIAKALEITPVVNQRMLTV